MTLFIGNSYITPTIIVNDGSDPTPTPTPTPTPVDVPTTLGSRIDNKATVVGVLQDHEGNDYVLAVVDAAYRSSSSMKWSTQSIDTPLQSHSSSTSALADYHTGKYNTDLILSTYSYAQTDYPAFYFARNACTITIGSRNYYSVLPNLIELQMLYDNKGILDQYDPTVSDYSSRAMSTFAFSASGAWSSSESDSTKTFCILSNGRMRYDTKDSAYTYGVCPVFCIPLD